MSVSITQWPSTPKTLVLLRVSQRATRTPSHRQSPLSNPVAVAVGHASTAIWLVLFNWIFLSWTLYPAVMQCLVRANANLISLVSSHHQKTPKQSGRVQSIELTQRSLATTQDQPPRKSPKSYSRVEGYWNTHTRSTPVFKPQQQN